MGRRALTLCVAAAVITTSLVIPAAPITAQTAPTSLTLIATIRDFKEDHPDFEGTIGSEKGIVAKTLGADGKPVYGAGYTTSGAANFNQWYRNTAGVNQSSSLTLTLDQVAGTNKYSYSNQAFFPIDNQYWGNEGREHNFWFTTEVHTTFGYEGGETFSFTGDDDLFVFVNKKLALDLGGVHPPESGSFSLDALATSHGLTKGKSYNLDIFHAERHWDASTFAIETSIELKPKARFASSMFPLTDRIAAAQAELQAQIDPVLTEYNRIDGEARMAVQSATDARDLHRFRLNNLETIEAQLKDLRDDIQNGISSSETSRMHDLEAALKEATLDELAQRLIMINKDREAQALLLQREAQQRKLVEFTEPLEALDFELKGLVVFADSTPVYRVSLVSPYPRLAVLDKEIAEHQANLEALETARKNAFANFQSAHMAATRKLISIAEQIVINSWSKALLDFGTSAIDVAIAASKGGPAGVITELASKIFETAIKDVIRAKPVGNPIPGQDQVDKWFNENAFKTVGDKALEIGTQRTLKETGVKLAKEWVADGLKGRWPVLDPGTPPAGSPAIVVKGILSKGMLDRVKDLVPKLKTETFNVKFKDWAKSSLGRKLVQDADKALWKRKLDNDEMESWRTYLMLDSRAHAQYGLWKSAHNAYWHAYDQIEARELEKNKILSEYDPATKLSTSLRAEFGLPQIFLVRLLVPLSTKPFGQVPVKVSIAGVDVPRTTVATDFQVQGNLLPTDTLGELVIEVK